MLWYRGDLWDYPADLYIATGNSVIKKNGALVMGVGSAKQMLEKYPGCDLLFGEHIKSLPTYPYYGFVFIPKLNIGLLQTKYDFRYPSSISLIKSSVRCLAQFARCFAGTLVLPVPGVGHGKLSLHLVKPLLDILPDNVVVAHRGQDDEV